jgi:metal-responsive CopG/Arc/MetJ family transcriptional regulator
MTGEEEAGTVKADKKVSDWAPVSLPKALLSRIDAVYEKLGYRSRAEYVRYAVLKQLDPDERLGNSGGKADGVPQG